MSLCFDETIMGDDKICKKHACYRNGNCLNTITIIFGLLLLNFNVLHTDAACHFDGYIAACRVQLLNRVTVDVTAVVNHCHNPIDVTFIVKSKDPNHPINWRYTFVTTNPPESPEIPHFEGPVFLHVYFPHRQHNNIKIQATFHVKNFQNVPIINSSVHLSSMDDCVLDVNKAGRVTLIIVLMVLLLIVCGTITGWICYKRKQTGERVALVDDMEVDFLSSSGKGSSDSTSSTICGSDSRESDRNVSPEPNNLPKITDQ